MKNQHISAFLYDYSTSETSLFQKIETYYLYTNPTLHLLGAGFVVGVNYRVFPQLVVSGELRQTYLMSFSKGTFDKTEKLINTRRNGKEEGYQTTDKVKSDFISNAFVYALPSISIRWLW